MVLVPCTSTDHALYLNQVLGKYLKGFQSYGVDMISILKITKAHNSIQMKITFQFLFSAHHLIMPSCMKISVLVSNL